MPISAGFEMLAPAFSLKMLDVSSLAYKVIKRSRFEKYFMNFVKLLYNYRIYIIVARK